MVKPFRCIALVGILVSAVGSRGSAQGRPDDGFNGLHLSGSINDRTTPTFGDWEIHGTWTLEMTGGPNGANFSAALTMEKSDLFFVPAPPPADGSTPPAPPDANNLTKRNAHTHHIEVIHGTVTAIPGGFRITSKAGETVVTGNGATAPFETNPPSSTVQIDITGGSLVTLSNIALTFGGAAESHFGSNPIAGVVSGGGSGGR